VSEHPALATPGILIHIPFSKKTGEDQKFVNFRSSSIKDVKLMLELIGSYLPSSPLEQLRFRD
jgi:hypothetical protein